MHTTTEALIIKRTDNDDFWQSVTGSLEWGEAPQVAAARELEEETGISGMALRSTGITRSYRIAEAWKPRYHPDAVRNNETLFYCPLAHRAKIQLNPREHDEWKWLPFDQAIEQVTAWSNRLAIKSLL